MTCDQFQITEVCNILISSLHILFLMMPSINVCCFACLQMLSVEMQTCACINICIHTQIYTYICLHTHIVLYTVSSGAFSSTRFFCFGLINIILHVIRLFKSVGSCYGWLLDKQTRPETHRQFHRKSVANTCCKKRSAEPFLFNYSEEQNTLLFTAVPHFHCSITL